MRYRKKTPPLFHDIIVILSVTGVSNLPYIFVHETMTILRIFKTVLPFFAIGLSSAHLCALIFRSEISLRFKLLFCLVIMFLLYIAVGIVSGILLQH